MAAGATYEPIATTTLGSAASTITFSSIAASWTDLRLVFTGTSANGTNFTVRLNNDSAANYSSTYVAGQGTAAQSGRFTNATEIYPALSLSTTPQMYTLDIFSYAGSTYKTFLLQESADKNGSGYVSRFVCLWRSTAAITSINITGLYGTAPNTFAIGTTATLYGIKAA